MNPNQPRRSFCFPFLSTNRRGFSLLQDDAGPPPFDAKERPENPVSTGHEAQFGLVVTERDETTSAVRAVTCQEEADVARTVFYSSVSC
ncbi:hypothetical protein PsorP6_007915 [Peronosclerospora sorghi]|uniref:Uncharacterized protein n=1 Tax=Peronosclerospora sorghi TaxID=230839 RepID=A0ACC0WAC6_9STRA|nr:hypothetical protein PsorP6_007915 [Peronosclerospora sorghi]